MRKAEVFMHGVQAGVLEELVPGKSYREFFFQNFPPFFDGLLQEGILLEGLLKQKKIDKYDYFSQLVAVGNDLVGAVTVQEKKR